MSDSKPNKFPSAWPSKGSTMRNENQGWTLRHKDRDPVVFKDGQWVPLQKEAA